MQKIFIIGCGDIGRRCAALWRARGAAVAALARSDASARRLEQLGITPVPGDLDQPATLQRLPLNSSLLYYFAPPPAVDDTDGRMRAVVAAMAAGEQPGRILYLSTTGVYGDNHGAWVTEDTPVRPIAARSKRRVDAETVLRAFGKAAGVPVIILRVPGIYGPGRLPIEAIRTRRPVLDESESGYTNRIHAEDLARVCLTAAERGRADTVYNVSDGHPSSMTGYFNQLADALGEPRPPVISRAEAQRVLSAGMLSYLDESRRVDNRRLREELGVELLYPTLEAGLRASLALEKL
jgi:nucleoside-diphosphate-sugar epimerase